MTEKEGVDHKILDVAVVVGAVPAVLYLFGTVALSATAHGYVIPSSLIHAEPWDIIAEGARAFLDLIPRSLKVGQWTAAVVAILGYAGLADSMRAHSMLRFAIALPLALIALCSAIALACDKDASKSLKEVVACSKDAECITTRSHTTVVISRKDGSTQTIDGVLLDISSDYIFVRSPEFMQIVPKGDIIEMQLFPWTER